MPARCIVDFSSLDAVDLSGYIHLTPLPIQGTLGLITLGDGIFLSVVTNSTQVATVRPGETVQRIGGVEFYCLNSAEYDYVGTNDFSHYSPDTLDGYDSDHGYDRPDPVLEHPCLELKKLLSRGSFYYSGNFDLTNRLQERSTYNATFDFDHAEDQFLWNSYMIKPLLDFRTRLATHEQEALDSSRILTSAIRGFALSVVVPAASSPVRHATFGSPSTLTLISRLSCKRAGTRFNARGIDDEGNVANFVETETVFYMPSGLCFSYVQVRGSVPVFWEQTAGLIPGQQKIQITRSLEATQPAFDKHFEDLEYKYGVVHVLNLLSETKPGEMDLTNSYRHHVRHSSLNEAAANGDPDRELILETEFDFHAQTKGPSGYEAADMIQHMIKNSTEGFAYFCSEQNASGFGEKAASSRQQPSVVLQQEGVFRTNCLDCLDRTNIIQTLISRIALEGFFTLCNSRASPDFWVRHSGLWADNGDCLSKIYAGTGALKTSFTRHGKMSLAGAFADARKSAARMYINNFTDKSRQNNIDTLLGRLISQSPVQLYDPINDFVGAELRKRTAEYSSPKQIRIWVGTFNLNGRTSGIRDDLSSWLCPSPDPAAQPDLVVVGFQEIVELSPQHIMSTDPSIRQTWEEALKQTLDKHAKKIGSEEYVLLRSGQLVGAALIVFSKGSALAGIKNVEGTVKKTGLSGVAGNKGAVAIRMDYADTRMCFVTAHLAAGFANYGDRNRDYNTINSGLRFQRNCSIEDHDVVIWLGDFNYRIGLADEVVRKLVANGDIETLYNNDQLNLQMVAGLTFPFYSEARITFLPTYRFDIGTDVYDTSEKHRIPAWCDRVLWKSNVLRNVAYNTCDLRFSDHRPVYACFLTTVNIVNEPAKERLTRRLYDLRRREVGHSAANKTTNDPDDEDLIGYDPIAPGLPPASSDRRRWWLDNGLPARSILVPPGPRSSPNPHRPSNPFAATKEADWVDGSPSPSSSLISRNRGGTGSASIAENPNSATTRRRLPPPVVSPRSVPAPPPPRGSGRKAQDRLGTEHKREPSTSQATSSKTTQRKPAPIVPKKPVELRSTNSETDSVQRGEAFVRENEDVSALATTFPRTASSPRGMSRAGSSATGFARGRGNHTKGESKEAEQARQASGASKSPPPMVRGSPSIAARGAGRLSSGPSSASQPGPGNVPALRRTNTSTNTGAAAPATSGPALPPRRNTGGLAGP